VFQEARDAYRDRKAEIQALREADLRRAERRADRRRREDYSESDSDEVALEDSNIRGKASDVRPRPDRLDTSYFPRSASQSPKSSSRYADSGYDSPRRNSRRPSYTSTGPRSPKEDNQYRRSTRDGYSKRDAYPPYPPRDGYSRREANSPRGEYPHRDDYSPRDGYSKREDKRRPSRLRFEDGTFDSYQESRGKELVMRRRNTDAGLEDEEMPRVRMSRSNSTPAIDENIRRRRDRNRTPAAPEEDELKLQVSKLQRMIDEANCAQHSVKAIIETFQKNPDQLAAATLTLGEITALASRLGPTAFTSIRTAFPTVFALVLSPQFMILAGVGLGVTVLSIGGYQVIKRLKKRRAKQQRQLASKDNDVESEESLEDLDENENADQLLELNTEIDRIRAWRKRIQDAEGGSMVEGEFITPIASKRLIEEGRLRESDLKKEVKRREQQQNSGVSGSRRRDDSVSVVSSNASRASRRSQGGGGKDSDKNRDRKDSRRKRDDNLSDNESLLDRGKALILDQTVSLRSLFSSKKDSLLKSF